MMYLFLLIYTKILILENCFQRPGDTHSIRALAGHSQSTGLRSAGSAIKRWGLLIAAAQRSSFYFFMNRDFESISANTL